MADQMANAAPSAKGTASKSDIKGADLQNTICQKLTRRSSLRFFWDRASNSIQPIHELGAGAV